MRDLLRCPLSVVALALVGPLDAQIGKDPGLGAMEMDAVFEFRRWAARIKQHTDSAICDLLDQFPAHGVLLERPRAKYHCGPGLPVTPK